MRIGLDFGTTNSSAAVFHNDSVQMMHLPVTDSNGMLPSLLYITRDHEAIVGHQAAEHYLADDAGRQAVWQTKEAGLSETDVEVVIRTGGSSQVRAIVDLLVARFGAESVYSYNPFLSVTAGLAIAAVEAYPGQGESRRMKAMQ